jgi:hypothetical protein
MGSTLSKFESMKDNLIKNPCALFLNTVNYCFWSKSSLLNINESSNVFSTYRQYMLGRDIKHKHKDRPGSTGLH